ncbi:MAG: hypothetical protein EAZ27_04525 [Cytophagales bacterium]|nr:MAG: hypothetical protein EAZ27_04525 [Cytophagales bacterium]
MGTPKNLNSVEALLLGFCGLVAEIGLGGAFKNNIGVFRGSLMLYKKFYFTIFPINSKRTFQQKKIIILKNHE